MSNVVTTTYVVNRLSNSNAYEWQGPNQDLPVGGIGEYSTKMQRYSDTGDTGISIQVHTFSSLDTGVSGTWTISSANPIPQG